jgi:ABC-2 type transport system permease protein
MTVSTRHAARAFGERDLRVALSYRVPFLTDLVAVTFTVVEMYFIAKLVPPARVQGGYFAFVVVGLVVAAVIAAGTSALTTGVRAEQTQGTLEVIAALGIPTSVLSVGLAVYPIFAAVVRAAIFVVAGMALGARFPGGDVPTAIVGLALGSVAFVGIGLVGAALVIVIRQATAAIAWLIGILTFAAGVAFPVEVLPTWLRTLAAASPVTVTLEVVRGALLGSESFGSLFGDIALLAAMALGSLLAGVAALDAGLRWARRKGTLALY